MQSAHLALIDGLMAVGAMETVAAVRKQGSAELLGGACSWEDALLHWVNQVRGPQTVFVTPLCLVFEIWFVNVFCFFLFYFERSQLNQKLRERTQEAQTDTTQASTELQPVQPSVSTTVDI